MFTTAFPLENITSSFNDIELPTSVLVCTYVSCSVSICGAITIFVTYCTVPQAKKPNSPLASLPNHCRSSDVIRESIGRHTVFRQTPTSSITYRRRNPRTLPPPRQHLHRTESDYHFLFACLVFMDYYHWAAHSFNSCLPVGMVHDDAIKGPCPLCFLGTTIYNHHGGRL